MLKSRNMSALNSRSSYIAALVRNMINIDCSSLQELRSMDIIRRVQSSHFFTAAMKQHFHISYIIARYPLMT